jgi:hydroxymethylbilane synthase
MLREKIAVIGGGEVALRKVKSLLAYGSKITVISPELAEGFKDICDEITYVKELYSDVLVRDADIVIAATSSREINREIGELCKMLKLRPDLDIVPIRGNIYTRIRKIDEMGLHGIVLAAAGLKRLGLNERISCYLEIDTMIPAPAQGALAIEIRANDPAIEGIVSRIGHKNSEIQIRAERSFLYSINGSCHVPMGAISIIQGEKLIVYGMLGSEDGKIIVKSSVEGTIGQEEQLGKKLAEDILKEMKILEG